jgi:DUF971 family protein
LQELFAWTVSVGTASELAAAHYFMLHLIFIPHHMSPHTPLQISRPKPYLLSITWSDGLSTTIALRAFRDACPCAACQGENIMGTQYGGKNNSAGSFGLSVLTPGMYELRVLNAVGNYAIAAEWADGHATGIYSWDILRNICERYALTEAQKQDLERLAGESV